MESPASLVNRGRSTCSKTPAAAQVGPDDLARNALAELAVQCCRRDAFHTLRTVEQLGYMVWLAGVPTLTVRAVAFVVQSSAFSAEHLEARCEAFVAAQLARLAELDDESFASQARTLPKCLPGMLHAGGAGTPLFLLTFAFSFPRRGSELEHCYFWKGLAVSAVKDEST